MKKSLLLLAVAGWTLVACKTKGVGLPCAISYGLDAGVEINPENGRVATTAVTVPALECESGICLVTQGQRGGDEGEPPVGLCTQRCQNDGDCEAVTTHCRDEMGAEQGFVCVKPLVVDTEAFEDEPRRGGCPVGQECRGTGSTGRCFDPETGAEGGSCEVDDEGNLDHCQVQLCVCKPYAIAAGLLCEDTEEKIDPPSCTEDALGGRRPVRECGAGDG